MKCTMKTVEKTTVVLRMSEAEAVVLRALLRNVGGLGHSGTSLGIGKSRRILDNVEIAMGKAGVKQLVSELDFFDKPAVLSNKADDILSQEGILND